MIKILINNNKYGKIVIAEEIDKQFISRLNTYLAYKQDGVEYTAAYKYSNWNGFVYLLSKKLEFSLGLLPRVIEFFKNHKQEFEVLDLRENKTKGVPVDISKRLEEIGKTPRDYQLDAVKACIDNERGIIRAATGSGKTLIAAIATASIGKPTIIMVIGKSLLYQFHSTFQEIFQDQKIGIIGDGICDPQNITIASIWSLGKALGIDPKKILNEADDQDDEKDVAEINREKILDCIRNARVHFLDECHVARCSTINMIYKAINPEHLYGLSGTPFKMIADDIATEAVLGKIIYEISATKLINDGILAQPIIKFVDVSGPKISGGNYKTVYKEYIVENISRNGLIVNQTKSLKEKGYTILVLFSVIKHGQILFDLFQKNDLDCVLLDGSDSQEKRQQAINKVNNGEVSIILASKIFEIGLDVPKLSALVLASGGKSFVLALQRIGRVIRPYPGKKRAAIVDFVDHAKYLKAHSKQRYKIYSMEDGFKIIWASNVKK
jgi:superfamily II DNA or RNA helicase